MTTKVIVDAHAGWPVQVEAIDQYPADAAPVTTVLGVVPPKEAREFYCTSTRRLVITELARPAAVAAEVAA